MPKTFENLTPLQTKEAIALYRKGYSVSHLSRKYNVTYAKLRRFFIREGVTQDDSTQEKKPTQKRSIGPETYTTVWFRFPNGTESPYRFRTENLKKAKQPFLDEGCVEIPDPYTPQSYSYRR